MELLRTFELPYYSSHGLWRSQDDWEEVSESDDVADGSGDEGMCPISIKNVLTVEIGIKVDVCPVVWILIVCEYLIGCVCSLSESNARVFVLMFSDPMKVSHFFVETTSQVLPWDVV